MKNLLCKLAYKHLWWEAVYPMGGDYCLIVFPLTRFQFCLIEWKEGELSWFERILEWLYLEPQY